MDRRLFLTGLSLLAAPAIVRADSLMRVSVPWLTLDDIYERACALGADMVTEHWTQDGQGRAAAFAILDCLPAYENRPPFIESMKYVRRIYIGAGWRTPSPVGRFGDNYTTRLVTNIPAQVRPAVMGLTAYGWRWKAV